MRTRVTLLVRDLVCSNENPPSRPYSHLAVKECSGEALSGSQGPSSGDCEKSVDLKSSGNSWVWIPSMHDLKTHYVCRPRELKYISGSNCEPWYTFLDYLLLDLEFSS